MGLYLSLVTAVISGIFAGLVWGQYRQRPSPHLAAWAAGLTLYSAASATQAVLFNSFDAALFQIWYWSGAMMVAPALGLGTLFLLFRRSKLGSYAAWALIALGVIGFSLLLQTPLNSTAFTPGLDLTEQLDALFSASATQEALRRALVVVLNATGTAALVGGALYSVWLAVKRSTGAARAAGNLLIAGGGLLPALGGLLLRVSDGSLKYAAQLAGALLLLAGFMVIDSSFRQGDHSQNKPTLT